MHIDPRHRKTVCELDGLDNPRVHPHPHMGTLPNLRVEHAFLSQLWLIIHACGVRLRMLKVGPNFSTCATRVPRSSAP